MTMDQDLNVRVSEFDAHWEEVLTLARRYGFINSSSDGVALISSHATQLQSYGRTGYFKIQRKNGYCPMSFGQPGCLTDSGQPALCAGCSLEPKCVPRCSSLLPVGRDALMDLDQQTVDRLHQLDDEHAPRTCPISTV